MRTSVDVHNFLTEREAQHEVFPARGRLRSSERLAAVLDLPAEVVGKVAIFERDGQAVAAVLPSGHEADPTLVARAVGANDLHPASDPRASELTEYLAESIPPAGLPPDITVVVDRSLDRDEVLYFPGGESRSVLKIRGTELVRATGATVAAIVRAERVAPGPRTRRG